MKHRHTGKYKSNTPKGGTVFKKRPIHEVSKKRKKVFKRLKPKKITMKMSYDEVEQSSAEELSDKADRGELTLSDIEKIEEVWDIDLSEYTQRNWDIDKENILNSKPKYGDEGDIKRFMFEPSSKTFILSGDEMHSRLLHAHKVSEPEDDEEFMFDDFIRGIYSKSKNKVFIRTWWKPDSPYDEYGVDDMDKSYEMQMRLKNQLKAMGVPEDTEVVFDIDNKQLMEEMGGRGW